MPGESAKQVQSENASVKKKANGQAGSNGVSVILVTNRPQFSNAIFANYGRQLYPKRELVIVLNNNKMKMSHYRELASKYKNVSVYQMDESASLGRCLNFAVAKSKYPVIAKFDDDDYYSPYYLHGVIKCLRETDADIIGKNTCYLYLRRQNLLLMLHPGRKNQYTHIVMGATLAFRRRVFHKVKFRNISRGEDTYFFVDCRKHKMKIYSCDAFNYVCIRRPNRRTHTWSVNERTLMKESRRIGTMKNFEKIITRNVTRQS